MKGIRLLNQAPPRSNSASVKQVWPSLRQPSKIWIPSSLQILWRWRQNLKEVMDYNYLRMSEVMIVWCFNSNWIPPLRSEPPTNSLAYLRWKVYNGCSGKAKEFQPCTGSREAMCYICQGDYCSDVLMWHHDNVRKWGLSTRLWRESRSLPRCWITTKQRQSSKLRNRWLSEKIKVEMSEKETWSLIVCIFPEIAVQENCWGCCNSRGAHEGSLDKVSSLLLFWKILC